MSGAPGFTPVNKNRHVLAVVSDRPGWVPVNKNRHDFYLVKTSKRGPGSILTLPSEPILRGEENNLSKNSA